MAATKKILEEAAMLRVEGLVQRVGFRRFAERGARKWKISGYVENLNDGSVKVFAQGVPENLQGFIEEIRDAPKPIVVDDIQQKKSLPRKGQKYFRIKTGSLGIEMQEGFGAMESQFTDYRGEFTNYRAEFTNFNEDFKDYRNEFKDYREEFKDYRNEFKDYRGEFRSFADRTDSNFKSLDTKYGEISAKLTDILTALQTENKEAIQSLNRSVDMLAKALERFSPPSEKQSQNSTN